MKFFKIFFSFIFFQLIFIMLSFQTAFSIEFDNSHLFELSFQELMATQVRTGSLLSLSNFNKPVSVTTINSNDIKLTPHRNLLDLIETYVPGAIFMNHYDVSSIGLRGLISDRNNKILIMINNKVSNQKARAGAYAELSNWDLGDIDRIEIIRGPGSATYGPGAISAVINIITKDFYSAETNSIKVNYINPYNSMGLSGQLTHSFSNDVKLFAYFSLYKTSGYEPENAYSIMYNGWNYQDAQKEVYQEYMADYLDIPQKKFQLKLELFNEFNFWVRYNNSGSTSNGASIKTYYQYGLDSNFQPLTGDLRKTHFISNEQFIAAFEHDLSINDNFSLSSLISYDIENNSRSYGYFTLWNKDDAPPQNIIDEIVDQSNIRNMYNYYSEREISGTFILRSEGNDKIRYALGTSLSYNTWGSPFGVDDNLIRMGDKSNIISGKDSPIYGDGKYFSVDSNNAIFVGNGWSTFMYSVFGEFEYHLSSQMSMLLSARLDKDDYSDYLISPRFALSYKLNDDNIVKIITQQSNRMNTAEELFFQNKAGKTSSPEKLNTAEIIYSTILQENMVLDIASYFNNIEILSWYDPDRTTRKTGTLSVLGFEIDGRFKNDNLSLGFNQSITYLVNWELADGVDKSGVSYSDYNIEFAGNTSNGIGNNLNNWSNLATKFYGNYSIIDNKLIIHLDARLLWGYDGAKDGLQLVREIIKGSEQEEKIGQIIDFMTDKGFYDYDLRVNASINYNIFNGFKIGLNMMNIPILGYNYRYKYEAGNKTNDYFFRMNVLEEPFTFGINLSYDI